MEFINRLMVVPVTDPDDARRRRLLNILLMGVTLVSLLALIFLVATAYNYKPEDSAILLYGSSATLLGAVGIYFINRFRSGKLASHLFLILLVIVMAFSDDPAYVSGGRSLFAFTIPIIMASVLLGSVTSFIYWAICSLVITGIALSINNPPNSPAILGFFLVALVAWLSARSLEQTLRELRLVNRELDQRVADRTLDLSNALGRERAEAGKNQAILEDIADGVLVFDIQDRVIIANPALCLLLQETSAALIGQSISTLVSRPELGEEDCKNLVGLLNNPGQAKSNIRVVWGESTFSVTAALVHDTSGERIGKVAVFRDFTREAEVEKLKSSFVAMVSHELRTPLNAVLGYAEMLKAAAFGALTEKQDNVVDRITTNTQRLLGIVNDILDQAQIEAGKVRVQMKPFKPLELLDGIYGVMDVLAQKKGLSLVSSMDAGFPATVSGDPDRIHQILVNLITNAIKFTDQGVVSVRLFMPNKTHWGMEISDTGVGISKDAQKYIFEPFRQVEDTATRRHGGVGLGLSIVKNFVTLMNGEIKLVSAPNQGTKFTLTFPLATTDKGDAE